MSAEIMGYLVGAARAGKCVEIVYRKKLTDRNCHPRVVELYSVSSGKQDLLLRAYQLEPEEGWRYFMLHKIESASMLDMTYSPRRPVTLIESEIEVGFEPSPHWNEDRKEYRDAVCDALADGRVTKPEFAELRSLISTLGLTEQDIRFVHASLFHRCLGAVLDDGLIDSKDQAEIRFLHQVFSKLGWTVGE